MGCTESNQVTEKQQTQRRPILTMVGTTIKGSMVLNFFQDNIQSQRCNVVLPKFANALLQSESIGFLTGGIEQIEARMNENTSIETQAYEGTISKMFYQVNVNKINSDPDNAFQSMPQMINARYGHCAVLLNGSLYVMGGRQYGDDQNGLLSACQRFSFSEQKWHSSAPLMYPRSGGVSVVYENHIYMFGGYTGNNTRNMSIETFSEGDQTWRKMPYNLHIGLEGLVALPSPKYPSSVYIFGGRTGNSKTQQVCQINFDNSTVRHCKNMVEKRSFHKAVRNGGSVYLFGGGPDNVEIYNLKQQVSQVDQQISYLEHCSTKDLTSFSQFQYQINLSYKKHNYSSPKYKNKVFILGHAMEPFTKIIDTDNLVVISQNQSLKHKFNQFQTSIRVNKEHSFIMGGINTDCTAVFNDVYSLNLMTEQIKELNPMKTARYGFPAIVKGSYLYVLGGRKLGGDEVAILNQCERFSFETYEWESIASMKYKRHSSFGVVYGDYLFAVGGYKGKGIRSNEMEVYLSGQNKWIQLQEKFELAVQSMTPINYGNSIFLFGGRAEQIDIQKVFKLKINIDEGKQIQKAVTAELEPMGNLSKPGTNLKVFVNTGGLAYVFGNIEGGIDVYDLKSNQIVQKQKLSVFESLEDKYFQSYTIAF